MYQTLEKKVAKTLDLRVDWTTGAASPTRPGRLFNPRSPEGDELRRTRAITDSGRQVTEPSRKRDHSLSSST